MMNVDPQFLGVDPAIWAAIIGVGGTIVAAALGAWMVAWQIGRQARLAIEQNCDNERLKLKLKVYEEILATCTRATDANIAASTYARVFLAAMPQIRHLKFNRLAFAPPVARWPTLLELIGAAKSTAIEFVCFVERWAVIDPRLEVFKYAFNVAIYDTDQTWKPYSNLAMILMPVVDPRTGQLAPWDAPSPEAEEALSNLTNALCEALSTLNAYTLDFQMETQSLLLSELFGNRAPVRQPLDPRLKVVTLDRADELRNYFESETPWAESVRQTISRVSAEVAGRAP